MFCGLDLGTSSVKAAIFDENGSMLTFSRRECDLLSPRIGWSELEPHQYLENVYAVLRDVFTACDEPVQSIALSSQAQATVPILPDGTPLYNIIVTMDNRTLPQYTFWRDHYDEWDIYQQCGVPFSAIYGLNKIMWHKENNPDLYSKTWKFCFVLDYIAYMLTGQGPFTDYSLAGRSMMFSAEKPEWCQPILDIAGIDAAKLSQPVPSTTCVGPVKPSLRTELHIGSPCTVVIGGHDQACGAIGSGVDAPGMLMDACGTVDAMVTVMADGKRRRSMLENGLPIYRHADMKNHITIAINTNGGLLFKWYKNAFFRAEAEDARLRGADIYTEIINQAAKTPADMYVLPHIEGAGSPYNDPLSCGAFIGIRSGYTKNDFSRAILDSLAYEMQINLLAIEASTDCPVTEIRMIGGGAKTPAWLQIKADIFNKTIATPAVSEAAVLGAAILGAVGTGAFSSVREAIRNMVKICQRYEPNTEHVSAYAERFAEYQELYETLKAINHRISTRVQR